MLLIKLLFHWSECLNNANNMKMFIVLLLTIEKLKSLNTSELKTSCKILKIGCKMIISQTSMLMILLKELFLLNIQIIVDGFHYSCINGNKKLTTLDLISIENKFLDNIDYECVKDELASKNVRTPMFRNITTYY
uniref:Uncharacterized protein n=1 Tax=Lactuca sativa TaxID=4236 RepID=A0A9R1W4C1_LACSA|nr:hypothetical protein LSAT_V11C300120650 [Lactuca sativa]